MIDGPLEQRCAIVILGAAVWADGPSPTLKRRTQHAAMLWHAVQASHVVACGGLGKHPPTEAEAMQKVLIDAGVPAHLIMQENTSTTTLENLRNAVPILKRLNARRVIIVTDLTHAPRAAMVARHFGLDALISSPSLHGARKRVVLRQAVREAGAIPLYAWRLWRAGNAND